MLFKWVAPTGAAVDRYDLVLYVYHQEGVPPKILSRRTVKNELTFTNELSDALPSGSYAWKVEAKDKDGLVIGGGQARFQVVADVYRRPGSFEVLGGVELDDIAFSSVSGGIKGDVSASFFGYLIAVDYRKDEKWSLLASFRNSSATFNSEPISVSELNLGASRRSAVSSDQIWNMTYGIRLASISTPQFTSQIDQSWVLSKVSRVLVLPSVGLSYQLSDAAAVYGAFTFGLGLSLSHSDPGTQGKAGNSLSFTTGVRGSLIGPWGFELETAYLRESYTYTSGTRSVSTDLRGYKVHIAATYTF